MAVTHGAVRKRAKGLITESWQSQANLAFFLALLILISFVLPSLGFGRDDVALYSNVGFTVMLLSGVALAWERRRLFVLVSLIGCTALVTRWLAWHRHTVRAEDLGDWCNIIAVASIAWVLLTQIFRPGRITHYRIQGAIAVYLLFGAAWARGYDIVHRSIPNSFNGPAQELSNPATWSYFSFVTLTTVGYGDITPLHQIARTLAVGEALAGQLFLAVLIARLVAMELVFWQQKVNNQ